jgi:hypothetical protein
VLLFKVFGCGFSRRVFAPIAPFQPFPSIFNSDSRRLPLAPRRPSRCARAICNHIDGASISKSHQFRNAILDFSRFL